MDPFNWFMIVAFGVLATVSLIRVVLFAQWGWVLFAVLSLLFLFYYVTAILTREIEIDDSGVRYREGARRLYFEWEGIEMITIEPIKGQITFLVNGKRNRIHEFGLPAEDRKKARQFLVEKAKTKGIPVKGE